MPKIEKVWSAEAWEDYLYWHKQDMAIWERVNELIKDIERSPFNGIGKPEPLKWHPDGFWSRRITLEHRLVYKLNGGQLIIAHCRKHYE